MNHSLTMESKVATAHEISPHGQNSADILTERIILLKGTVRPDWISMRVVSLDRPQKGHPLQVLDFLILIANI
jgi:hypothetical protein